MEKNNFYIRDNKKHKLIRTGDSDLNIDAYCTEHKEKFKLIYFAKSGEIIKRLLIFYGFLFLLKLIFINNGIGFKLDLFNSVLISIFTLMLCFMKFKGEDYLRVK